MAENGLDEPGEVSDSPSWGERFRRPAWLAAGVGLLGLIVGLIVGISLPRSSDAEPEVVVGGSASSTIAGSTTTTAPSTTNSVASTTTSTSTTTVAPTTSTTSTTVAPSTTTVPPTTAAPTTTTTTTTTTAAPTTTPTTTTTTTVPADTIAPIISMIQVGESEVYEDPSPGCATQVGVGVHVNDDVGVVSVTGTYSGLGGSPITFAPAAGIWGADFGPFTGLPAGYDEAVTVTVTARDAAGNTATRDITFFVRDSSFC